MAAPTLAQIRATAVTWWRELAPAEVPRLDTLTARIAALFTDPGAIVRARIENRAGVYVLVAELELGGTVVPREWQPTNGDRQQDLADVYDGARGGRSMRQDGAA